MIKTQMLHAGDLVAYQTVHNKYKVGMIIEFNEAFTSYKIQWFDKHLADTKCGWLTAQEYRNIYLAFRATL